MIHPVIQRVVEYKLGHVKLTKIEERQLAVDFYNHRVQPAVPWSLDSSDPFALPVQKILSDVIEELLTSLDNREKTMSPSLPISSDTRERYLSTMHLDLFLPHVPTPRPDILLIDRIVSVLDSGGPLGTSEIAKYLLDVPISRVRKCVYRNTKAGRKLVRQGDLIRLRR